MRDGITPPVEVGEGRRVMSMELEKMEEGSVYLLLAVYCISTSACFEE